MATTPKKPSMADRLYPPKKAAAPLRNIHKPAAHSAAASKTKPTSAKR